MKQFILEGPYTPNSKICLTNKAFKYLVLVRRLKCGDEIDLLFSSGEKLAYMVSSIDRKKQELFLEQSNIKTKSDCCSGKCPDAENTANDDRANFGMILMPWLLKANKMDDVVRQATEIGTHFILPVSGEFSQVQEIKANKLERYKRIIKEARQQSNSPIATEIMPSMKLDNALKLLPDLINRLNTELAYTDIKRPETLKLCFTEKNVNTKSLHQLAARSFTVAILAIGAEGGISFSEYEALKAASFELSHFNTNILRAETASIYALAALQSIKTEGKLWQLKE